MHAIPVWRWPAAFLLLLAGCTSASREVHDRFSRRINPVDGAIESLTASGAVAKAGTNNRGSLDDCRDESKDRVTQTSATSDDHLPTSASVAAGTTADPESMNFSNVDDRSSGSVDQDGVRAGQLNLPAAIELSFRMQPRLRVFLESIQQARAQSDIAYAPFLPTLSGGIGGGGVFLNVEGQASGFSFLPPGAVIPIGLNLQSGFGVADLRMQWLICDFGRRAGRYNQAGLGLEIAQLQTERAFQTVANDVTIAYYQVLRADSIRRIAEEAVRRADDELDVARKLEKQGTIEREKVLRSEVQLAQSQRLVDTAEGSAAISVAALNLAIGINVSSPTSVVAVDDIPPLPGSLSDCLQTAVERRRELDVARRGVESACEGQRVAQADFAPKVVADATYVNFQQATPQTHLDFGVGFIKLEWGLFEGGRRVGEVRVADSKMRSAMALAESIADTISFQITEAYRQMVTARKGIDRAQPAVDQARENDRLVKARAAQGDATPADMTDAETALIRAEQDHVNSIYDYLTALARLEFAMGISPTRASFQSAE
jgi:outer membrane protein TolC